MIPMDIGITGSRHPMPTAQKSALISVILDTVHSTERIRRLIDAGSLGTAGAKLLRGRDRNDSGIVIHHGCCIGADEAAHQIAKVVPGVVIHGHPGHNYQGHSPYLMQATELDFDRLYPRKIYNERNQDIVDICDVLIAVPQWPEHYPQSQRSGTWQTIHMARRAEKLIIYVMRDGTIERGDHS